MATDRFTVEDILNHVFAPLAVTPVAVETTDTYARVTGADLDTKFKKSVSFTIENTDVANSLDWRVIGANASDYSDAAIVQVEAAVAAAAFGSFAVTQAPYRYYGVEIKATVGASQGDGLVRGYAKG